MTNNEMKQHTLDELLSLTKSLRTKISVLDALDRDETTSGASDLSDFILDRPLIKYWLHGHIHATNDYMVGDCRVISNPRGYVMESKYDYGERNVDFESEFSFSS